jgi:hypothetical protein
VALLFVWPDLLLWLYWLWGLTVAGRLLWHFHSALEALRRQR